MRVWEACIYTFFPFKTHLMAHFSHASFAFYDARPVVTQSNDVDTMPSCVRFKFRRSTSARWHDRKCNAEERSSLQMSHRGRTTSESRLLLISRNVLWHRRLPVSRPRRRLSSANPDVWSLARLLRGISQRKILRCRSHQYYSYQSWGASGSLGVEEKKNGGSASTV